MFWVVILVVVVIIVGASVLIGKSLDGRGRGGRRLSKQEKMTMAKASGAFANRKESRD